MNKFEAMGGTKIPRDPQARAQTRFGILRSINMAELHRDDETVRILKLWLAALDAGVDDEEE